MADENCVGTEMKKCSFYWMLIVIREASERSSFVSYMTHDYSHYTFFVLEWHQPSTITIMERIGYVAFGIFIQWTQIKIKTAVLVKSYWDY